MNKLSLKKLFPIFVAISAVVIAAGIILYALLGFNASQDRPTRYTFDVRYNDSIAENAETLQNFAETTFSDMGIAFSEKEVVKVYTANPGSSSYLGETSYRIARYTVSVSDLAMLEGARAAIQDYADTNSAAEDSLYFWGEVRVSWNEVVNLPYNTAAWRGAIALALGAVVALAYVAIRFGVSLGVAGFVCCVHDALFTLGIFAIARIPVFSAAPLLYAAIAMLFSAILWIFFAGRVRANYKEPEFANLPAGEVAERTVKGSVKYLVIIAAALASVILLVGLVAVSGTRALVLPAIISAVVPLYSTLLIGPGVFAPIRKAFDKKRAEGKKRYVGKKKKAEAQE